MGQRRGLTPDSRPERASCPGRALSLPAPQPRGVGSGQPCQAALPSPRLSKAYLQPPHPLQPFFKKGFQESIATELRNAQGCSVVLPTLIPHTPRYTPPFISKNQASNTLALPVQGGPLACRVHRPAVESA